MTCYCTDYGASYEVEVEIEWNQLGPTSALRVRLVPTNVLREAMSFSRYIQTEGPELDHYGLSAITSEIKLALIGEGRIMQVAEAQLKRRDP